MSNPRLVVAAIGITLTTAGCGPTEWQLSASCEESKKCRIEGRIGGKIGGGERDGLRWFDRIMLASAAEVPDAARFEIDVSGSSVAFPANGSVTLQLFDPQQGVTIASRQFQWHRTGNILRLVDPDGANTWAAAESGPATELRYDLATFDVGAAPGPNTIAAASRYGGATKAASVSDFQVCTKYPSPYQCGLTP